jgi:hypothetical protein
MDNRSKITQKYQIIVGKISSNNLLDILEIQMP